MSTTTLQFEDNLSEARRCEAARDWDRALAAYGQALDQVRDPRQRSELTRKVGLIHYQRGEYGAAGAAFGESERIAAAANAVLEQAHAINCAGTAAFARGELEAAEAEFRRARPLAESCGKTQLLAKIDQNLATLCNVRGDSEAALEFYGSVITRFEAAGDETALSAALNNAGLIYAEMESTRQAESYFERALQLAQARGHAELTGTVLLNQAELLIQQKRLDEARRCCDQAFTLFGRIESRSGMAEACKVYGVIMRETSHLDIAEAHLQVATTSAEEHQYIFLHAQAEAEYALVHLARGANQQALIRLNRAHRLFESMKVRRELVNIEGQLNKLEGRYLQVTEVWGDSIEKKDEYTAGHCSRVADYTTMLAEAVGYYGRELSWIRMGSFLHDVGKTAVDAEILNKPGKLTPQEWEIMQRHTVIGDEIISGLDFPYDIRPIVRNHHEHWDGTGYPDRLMGDQIPHTARILCVADVYDALTTTRSYRKAFTREEALRIMSQEAGTVLDPTLFELFTRRLEEENR